MLASLFHGSGNAGGNREKDRERDRGVRNAGHSHRGSGGNNAVEHHGLGGSGGVGPSSGGGGMTSIFGGLFRKSSVSNYTQQQQQSSQHHQQQPRTSTKDINNSLTSALRKSHQQQLARYASSSLSIDTQSTVKQSQPKKLTKQKGNTTTSLAKSIKTGAGTGTGVGAGGYGYTKPSTKNYSSDEKSTLRRQAFPTLLATNSLFPKPAGLLYSVRSALSSVYSSSNLLYSPPASQLEPVNKKHTRRQRSPTPTRRLSSTQKPRIADASELRRKLPPAPTPPVMSDSREMSYSPRTSRRSLQDDEGLSKSRSKSKHRHRNPDEKRRKRRTKDDEGLEVIDKSRGSVEPPSRRPPSPPRASRHEMPSRKSTPVQTTANTRSRSRPAQGGVLQAMSNGVNASQSALPQTSLHDDKKRTLLSMEQSQDAIRLTLTPAQFHTDVADLIEDNTSDSDSSGLRTPTNENATPQWTKKSRESLREGSDVRIMDVDVPLSEDLPSIDFLLPYGGLGEQFDTGYEIEQDVDEDDYSVQTESEASQDSRSDNSSQRDNDPGFTDTHEPPLTKTSKRLSSILTDPLTQQMPLLLSLIENTVSAYETILDTQGSFAVGISGYKSVARLLLDRVGDLFTRKLSPDAASWGECLEWTGGRRKKPTLPENSALTSDNLHMLFQDSSEKLFIYKACLQEPDVLDPAKDGLSRLYPNASISPEITSAYLTLYPQLRPLLQALSEMTPDELDLLKSKRLRSFLDVEDGIKSDEEREIRECDSIADGIAKSLLDFEIVADRLKAIKSKVTRRKAAILDKFENSTKIAPKQERVPSEVKLAMEEIKSKKSHVHLTPENDMNDLAYEAVEEDDHDDTDTLIPDDSASQFSPYAPRRHFSRSPLGISEVGGPTAKRPPSMLSRSILGPTSSNIRLARPSSPAPSVFTTLTNNTSATAHRKKKIAHIKVTLTEDVKTDSKPVPFQKKGKLARLEEIIGRSISRSSSRMSRIQEADLEPRSISRSQSKRSARNIELDEAEQADILRNSSPRPDTMYKSHRTSKTKLTSTKERSTTPISMGRGSPPPLVLSQSRGVGGYGSSTPIPTTTETVILKKDKKDREKRRDGDGEKRKKRSSKDKDKDRSRSKVK